MAGYGIPHDDIAKLVINPDSGEGISHGTLRQHFRTELDRGHITANTKVVGGMFKNATTPTKAFPGGIPVSQIFWTKVRMGWRDRPGEGEPAAPSVIPAEKMTPLEVVRRLAFLMHQAGRAQQPATIDAKPKQVA